MQDRVKNDVFVTSKHRSLGQVDWSRQLSRELPPYFVPQPTQESRVQLGTGVDRPRRHQATLDMERSAPKPRDPPPDNRDYSPKLHEDLHPRCGVAIGKTAGRGNVFGVPQHQSEAVVEVELHPGWGRGKKSVLGRAPRFRETPPPDRTNTPTPAVYSAYTPIPETPAFEAVESRLSRPKGGVIPRTDERKLTPAPDLRPLEVKDVAVGRHTPTLSLDKSSRHFAGKRKESERYRDMFRTPPPAPLSTAEYPRRSNGFAPQRQSTDRSVSSLLATADADLKRAKKLVTQNFGTQSRSSVRTAMLYTPSPAGSPTPTTFGRLSRGGTPAAGGNATPAPAADATRGSAAPSR